ncbi:MAG: Rrf2 family transcriptional regulator [Ruminococcaceae bacterium]|nr:Rrf2 family transcriptional regulator [Oscillospiraceae bacterium]
MRVSTRGRYALKIMLDLAMNEGEYMSLKGVADRQGVSAKYLEQIITMLMSAKMIKSTRGKSGGYKLSRAPSEYTVGEILRATEGSLAPISCVEDSPNQCVESCRCPTLFFWEGLNKVINEYIDGTTLEDVVNQEKTLNKERQKHENICG